MKEIMNVYMKEIMNVLGGSFLLLGQVQEAMIPVNNF